MTSFLFQVIPLLRLVSRHSLVTFCFHTRDSTPHSPPSPTLKDVLELVLLQAGSHHLLNGADVLVELDHQRVIVHALHIGHDGIVALLGQGNEVMETVHSVEEERERESTTREHPRAPQSTPEHLTWM